MRVNCTVVMWSLQFGYICSTGTQRVDRREKIIPSSININNSHVNNLNWPVVPRDQHLKRVIFFRTGARSDHHSKFLPSLDYSIWCYYPIVPHIKGHHWDCPKVILKDALFKRWSWYNCFISDYIAGRLIRIKLRIKSRKLGRKDP